jgi:P27 family predicted phage terminase small subunit
VTALDPPPFLSPESRRIWTETREQLLASGTIARVNPDALLAFVSAVSSHRRATQLLEQTDVLVEDATTHKPAANPALEVQQRAATVIDKFTRQFGLNRRTLQPMTAADPMTVRGRWCETHSRWECTANRTRGRGLCHDIAVLGLGRCRNHAGVKISESPAHLLAQQRQRNPMAGEPMDITPAKALLWRVGVIAAEVARLDELIAALEADELVWGKVKETEGEEEGRRTEYAARLNVWLLIRKQREDALHAACTAAISAGLEERLVRVAEAQGALFHRIMITALGRFGIPPDDARIPEIMPAVIRELTAS